MSPSNLKHFLVQTVNLFKFKKKQNYKFLFSFFLWFFFIFILNGPLRSNTAEKREIFRSKNLLTAKSERNFSIEQSLSTSNDEQNRRQRRLQYECQSRQFLSKPLQQSVTLLTNPDRTLGYCHVPKIATSSWMLVFAELNNLKLPPNNSNDSQLLKDNYLHRAVLGQFSMKMWKSNDDDENYDSMFRFVFLRHPFERLVSAFYDKFVEDPDPKFVKSVIHHEPSDAEHLRWTFEKFEKEKKLKRKIADVITFPRFVKFILHELEHQKVSHGTYHWIRYTDFCGLCTFRYNFIGKLETLQNDLACLKTKFSPEVSSKMSEIFSVKKNASRNKSRQTSKKYFSQLSKDMIRKLYQAYESDFLIGGYPYPDNYINLGI